MIIFVTFLNDVEKAGESRWFSDRHREKPCPTSTQILQLIQMLEPLIQLDRVQITVALPCVLYLAPCRLMRHQHA